MTKCIVCNSEKSTTKYKTSKIHIVKCKDCSLVYQVRSTDTNKENELQSYYKNRETVFKPPPLFMKRRHEFILKRIGMLNTKKDPLLVDVGTGWGSFLESASNRFSNLLGIEPNKIQAEWGKKNGLMIKNEMYDSGTFADEQVDIMTFIQVMEHVDNPQEVLEIVHKQLKPNGLVVIDVPSYNNPRILLYRMTGIKKLVEEDFIIPHTFYFTPKSLSEISKDAGFKIELIDLGQYSIKTNNAFLKPIDMICQKLNIGSITLYARKM